MTGSGYDAATRLASQAERLRQPGQSLPTLFAFTDPERTPDPVQLACALPPGAALIARGFGDPGLKAQWPDLVTLCHSRGVLCLFSAEPELAVQLGADGVHWPEKWLTHAHVKRSPGLITTSAHTPSAMRQAQTLADAVFVSTLFASNSPSAKRPIGLFRAQAYARRCQIPVYGLGGVKSQTVRRLIGTGLAGVGAVEAVLPTQAISHEREVT